MKSPITYKRLLEKVPGLPKELNVGPMSKRKGTTEVTSTSHLMPADVNFAAWIGIPLAMVAGAGKEYALALAVPLSSLGVLAVYGLCAINLYFVHKQDADVEAGKLDAAARIPLVGQITNFVLRFFPILLINFFGQDLITALVNALPVQVTDILQIFSQHAAARRLHAPHAHDLQA
ncbi:PTS sugar transporter subunit IIC [Tractidigestivibacter sp.]|uniref:PTS sugar transporter subunit IIC n=1 Tax=Tractidigestivibacter sp. TaxID=2847320 RepID=UPI003AEFC0E8